ncbi:PH domain-containing protein [Bacillus sp. 1P06AnD]|uniref:PH domain-containing protein n=1 Tax=Bacillus sp. 1P06AnD TaxID=3132208 RepID=UPI0039A2E94D
MSNTNHDRFVMEENSLLIKKQVREQLVEVEKKYQVNLDMYRNKLAFKDLPDVLFADEVIQFITAGYYNGNNYMLVCTNKRILAMDKGMLYKLRLEEIPLNRIKSVSYRKKLLFAEMEIITTYATITIDQMYKDQVAHFAAAIEEQLQP